MKQASLRNLFAALAVTSLLLAGCSASDSGDGSVQAGDAPEAASASTQGASQTASDATIRLVYVEWDSCLAATNVARVVLEDAGFNVRTISVTGAMMYQGLATDAADATLCAWLPTTHADYYARTKDRLENLGPNMGNATSGLAMPAYMDADSISDLADDDLNAALGGRIVGIDPGAGVMRLTHNAIDQYDLPETLIEGSDATMTAALANAIRQHKPIVFTAWKPHWMWQQFDLRYLDDPQGIYPVEEVDTLVRKGFQDDMPHAFAILDAMQISAEVREKIMLADREPGADPQTDARHWVENHPDVVAQWLPESG